MVTTAELDRLALLLDPALMMADLGFEADAWQAALLRSTAGRMLLCASRQVGKSTTTAVLALHTALLSAGALVLVLSPSQRQSGELFRKITASYDALGRPIPAEQVTATTLALSNGSRVVSLPGEPSTIRGFSAPALILIDEAAQTGDELFVATAPMLATGGGRLVALSTPFGKRGWFHDAWHDAEAPWERIKVRAAECPRISSQFLAEQRATLGPRWFAQEYECSFEETLDQFFAADAIAAAFDPSLEPLFGAAS